MALQTNQALHLVHSLPSPLANEARPQLQQTGDDPAAITAIALATTRASQFLKTQEHQSGVQDSKPIVADVTSPLDPENPLLILTPKISALLDIAKGDYHDDAKRYPGYYHSLENYLINEGNFFGQFLQAHARAEIEKINKPYNLIQEYLEEWCEIRTDEPYFKYKDEVIEALSNHPEDNQRYVPSGLYDVLCKEFNAHRGQKEKALLTHIVKTFLDAQAKGLVQKPTQEGALATDHANLTPQLSSTSENQVLGKKRSRDDALSSRKAGDTIVDLLKKRQRFLFIAPNFTAPQIQANSTQANSTQANSTQANSTQDNS